MEAGPGLHQRLADDQDVDAATLTNSTDQGLGIGRDVWRMLWRGQITTAVGGDADLHTTCGAVLDSVALHEAVTSHLVWAGVSMLDPADASTVNVLVDRPLPGDDPSETAQAVRSVRDATGGLARIWYRHDDRWVQDVAAAPTWTRTDGRVSEWVNHLMLPRLTASPGSFALALVAAVDDPSLQLYPSEITHTVLDRWALRIDGLQIGVVGPAAATLTIGKPGKAGDGPQRQAFIDIAGAATVSVTPDGDTAGCVLDLAKGARLIRALLRRFRETDVPGSPITHRHTGGQPIVDEHTLEARLLKGIVTAGDDVGLVGDDTIVARGSQFPTLWGHGASPRYLDALLRRGHIPLAVELKVATGGQGRYYRRALVQAVLYRHFIRNAPGLDPWFVAAGLERTAIETSIAIPTPRRWTPTFQHSFDLLRAAAARVDATVRVLDDRTTPAWTRHSRLPEPAPGGYEVLSWRLAGALSARWPRSLGQILELHTAGIYDELHLQPVNDRTLGTTTSPIAVRLNRAGSLWVFGPGGSARWSWSGIWNHLAADGDPHEAARIVGAIAGLGAPEKSSGPTFPQLATAFLDRLGSHHWTWRNAAPDACTTSAWVERYRSPTRNYGRATSDGTIPTIARIWGLIDRTGEAAALIDQRNLRVWTWHEHECVEHIATDPYQRIADAAATIASSASPPIHASNHRPYT
jgi:hypothetical protein